MRRRAFAATEHDGAEYKRRDGGADVHEHLRGRCGDHANEYRARAPITTTCGLSMSLMRGDSFLPR